MYVCSGISSQNIENRRQFPNNNNNTLFAKMDLMCNEKEMFKDHHHHHHQAENHMQQMLHHEPQVNTASADPTFLSERCLENLLKSEETHPSLINFYNNPQCEITPKMRRIVAEWMMEVSAECDIFVCHSIEITQSNFYDNYNRNLHTLCNRLVFIRLNSIFAKQNK